MSSAKCYPFRLGLTVITKSHTPLGYIATRNYDTIKSIPIENINMFLFFVTDCPSGTHRDIINGCATCPIGTYMDRPNREDSCIQCPEGTTTTGEGSVSEQDCDGENTYNEDRVIIFAFSQLVAPSGTGLVHRKLTIGMMPDLLPLASLQVVVNSELVVFMMSISFTDGTGGCLFYDQWCRQE